MNYEEIKYKLNNVYFINGTAYAGKSTIVKMISDRLGLYFCGENYNLDKVLTKVKPKEFPNLCYFKTMKSWDEYVSRAPGEYNAWITGRQVRDLKMRQNYIHADACRQNCIIMRQISKKYQCLFCNAFI